MLHFSRKEDYAIIIINKLAKAYNKRLVPISEIAREYKISILFLRNLARELKKAGIVRAIEGKSGGYFLVKNPKTLKMGKVLAVFSRNPILPCCSFGRDQQKCPKEKFCEPGFVWRRLNKEFIDKVYNLSLSDFLNYRSLQV